MTPGFPELRIRHADLRDVASLADIKRRVEDETYSSFGTQEEHRRSLLEFCSLEYVAGLIEDPDTTVLVAEQDGGVAVGLAALTRGSECDLLNAVYATVQGQGIGSSLCRAAAELALSHRQRVLCCETFQANVPATRFFRSLGFRPFGERPSDSYASQILIRMRASAALVRAQTMVLLEADRHSAAPTSSG